MIPGQHRANALSRTPLRRTGEADRPDRLDSIRVWFKAVRFFSFTASTIPILVGSSLAFVDHAFTWWLFLVMLVASIACHAGANLANDYFDYRKGIDTDESLGPSKVIQLGLLSSDQVKRGTIKAFALAAALGAVIVWNSGWPVFVLAIFSLAIAIFYTAGPKPLGYVALGELAVFLAMGPAMVGGSYYVLAEQLTWEAAVLSLPIGFLVAAILHANNIRDMSLDRAAGKITLANLLGRRFATVEYAILIIAAYLTIAALIVTAPRFWPVAIVVVTLPVANRLIRTVASGPDMLAHNRVLRKTAGLHLRFGALVTLGLLTRALLDRT
jgi:1,4-dihydroxy-2-naphthoate polyprenyltransferase